MLFTMHTTPTLLNSYWSVNVLTLINRKGMFEVYNRKLSFMNYFYKPFSIFLPNFSFDNFMRYSYLSICIFLFLLNNIIFCVILIWLTFWLLFWTFIAWEYFVNVCVYVCVCDNVTSQALHYIFISAFTAITRLSQSKFLLRKKLQYVNGSYCINTIFH